MYVSVSDPLSPRSLLFHLCTRALRSNGWLLQATLRLSNQGHGTSFFFRRAPLVPPQPVSLRTPPILCLSQHGSARLRLSTFFGSDCMAISVDDLRELVPALSRAITEGWAQGIARAGIRGSSSNATRCVYEH